MSPQIEPPQLPENQAESRAANTDHEYCEENLKILRVASDLYPDVMGGLSLHVHEMSRLQAELGHDVTVLTSDHGNRDLPSSEERSGYELIRHRELASPFDNTIIPGIFKSIRKMAEDYDVVHAHSHLFFSTNAAALLNRTIDPPLVVTNHGLISQTAPTWVQKAFIPTVAKPTLNAADEVLCYTEIDAQRLRDRGVTTSVSVVHNGIDCEQFRPVDDINTKNQILFVGRLKPGKGLNDLIDAFTNIAPRFPEYELSIVGDGPLMDSLSSTVREKGVASRVHFTGNVENGEMVKLYNQSEVFVLPSLSEGLPRTVLEAMACEVPVVVSNLDQLESLVDDAGITVPTESASDLSSAINTLLSDSNLRERMGEVGRERVLNNYSWEETVRETNKVLCNLLD